MKIRHHIPSLFTLVNLFLGFLAILYVQRGYPEAACYVIMIAAVFDSLDGKLARMFGIHSNFGMEIDSLADLVSFCLAPSVLIYTLYTSDLPGISGELIASAPLILGAIRLARFNVAQTDGGSSSFIGLPTPVSALSIAALVLWTENVKAGNPEYSQPKLLLPIILSISFLMVSKVQYPKFPILNLHVSRANTIKLGILALMAVSFFTGYFFDLDSWVLLAFASYYIISGILRRLLHPDIIETTVENSNLE